MTPAADALRELAPRGSIRVALNVGNAATVTVTPDGVDGPAPRVIAALRDWTRLPVDVTRYKSAREVVDAAGAWDVACLAVDPARAGRFHFSPGYLAIEATAAVRTGSPIENVAALDAPGIRIASSQGAAYDLVLQRTLRMATRVPYADPAASWEGFERDGLDAVAGIRETLVEFLAGRPDMRLLDGVMATITHALAVPADRPKAARLVDDFVREALPPDLRGETGI